MMNEEEKRRRMERLRDEERLERLRQGGESMRAQLAMEESQRAGREQTQGGASFSGLTPQEEERRRRMMETRQAPEAPTERLQEYMVSGEDRRAEAEMEMREMEYRESQGGGYGQRYTPQQYQEMERTLQGRITWVIG